MADAPIPAHWECDIGSSIVLAISYNPELNNFSLRTSTNGARFKWLDYSSSWKRVEGDSYIIIFNRPGVGTTIYGFNTARNVYIVLTKAEDEVRPSEPKDLNCTWYKPGTASR
jgi:hypothetical protein